MMKRLLSRFCLVAAFFFMEPIGASATAATLHETAVERIIVQKSGKTFVYFVTPVPGTPPCGSYGNRTVFAVADAASQAILSTILTGKTTGEIMTFWLEDTCAVHADTRDMSAVEM